jgi:hypothetical protein
LPATFWLVIGYFVLFSSTKAAPMAAGPALDPIVAIILDPVVVFTAVIGTAAYRRSGFHGVAES